MKKFNPKFIKFDTYHNSNFKPDFNNFLKVLQRKVPDRPTLFEFFLNNRLYSRLSNIEISTSIDPVQKYRVWIKAYKNAGYDYVTVMGSDFAFPTNRRQTGRTISINEGGVIWDRRSYENYEWPDPCRYNYSHLDTLADELPYGMKFIVWGPGGVLENVIALVGYESLCYMLIDDLELVEEIFNQVGSRLVKYYEICREYNGVGALISNDDWGFNSQTMLSTENMKKLVIPWHKKIADTIHAAGKPAILHSCGQLELVMDDIIDNIKYDAKHSYEDKIIPVEKAYDEWSDRIAILGGIDLDFICRSTPEEIYERSAAMLEKTMKKGGYALGSGNSIPDYVPDENYLAMISAVNAL